MGNWNIDSEEKAKPEDVRYLINKLKDFNDAHTPTPFERRDIRLFVRNDSGEIVGGLLASVNMHCLAIQILWIEENLRHQGLGKALVLKAEEMAREAGASQAIVETTRFQAPHFYEKLGFVTICEINDSPQGSASILMRKAI